mgnify:CR=1 FL=1
MSKLCKTYIKKVKILFPIMGKSERNFIKPLKINIDDFLSDKPTSNLEDLYKEFGPPEDVVNSYYTSVDTNNIIKRIKISKYVRLLIFVMIICLLSLTTLHFYISSEEHRTFMEEQVFFEDTIIK